VTQAAALWCPRCLGAVEADEAACPRCRLGQGADAARLRAVVRRLYEVGEQRRALEAEAATLGSEQARLLQALDPRPSRASSRAMPEWRAEVVRGLLLGLGSVLVALAALIFAAVTWVRLGDLGRAGLLAAATLVIATAAAAARRHLPATAEALGGLALALLLVDWYALGRAGVANDWPASAWWALGTGIAAATAAAAGRRLRVQRPAAAALLQVSALLLVVTVADASWTAAVGLALVATLAAGAAASPGVPGGAWRWVRVVLGAGAAALELAALGLAVDAAAGVQVGELGSATGPALALAAIALAPAAAWALRGIRPDDRLPDLLVGLSAGPLLASAGVLLAAAWTSWSLAAAVAVLGAAAVGTARALPQPLRLGTTLAADLTLTVGLIGLAEPILWAMIGPAGWVLDPWTAGPGARTVTALQRVAPLGPEAGVDAAVVGLLAAVAGSALAIVPGRGPRVAPWLAGVIGLTAGVGIVAVLPLALAWPLWATTTLTTAAALLAGTATLLLDRRAHPVAGQVTGGAWGALLVLAVAWALATEAGTLACLGMLGPAAVAGAGAALSSWLRRACGAVAAVAAVGEGAAVAVHLGAGAAGAGVAVAVASGVALVAGARWRWGSPEGPVVESLGLAGLAVGAALAAVEQDRLAEALTVAAPALLAAAGPGRRHYRWAGSVVAVAAIWAWLVVADVTVLEAYTLPAAAVALGAGVAARDGRAPHPGSWPVYGPGLALALLPSLALATDGRGLARPLLLSGGALLVVLAGARSRLQAPLVLGTVTLLGLAVDAAWPVAAQLPRWTTVGGSGLLLLWLGATAERRLARLRQLRRRFQELEPDGAATWRS
jgi:hypothetical protein